MCSHFTGCAEWWFLQIHAEEHLWFVVSDKTLDWQWTTPDKETAQRLLRKRISEPANAYKQTKNKQTKKHDQTGKYKATRSWKSENVSWWLQSFEGKSQAFYKEPLNIEKFLMKQWKSSTIIISWFQVIGRRGSNRGYNVVGTSNQVCFIFCFLHSFFVANYTSLCNSFQPVMS